MMKDIQKGWSVSRKIFFLVVTSLLFFAPYAYTLDCCKYIFGCCKRRKKTHKALPSPQYIYQLTEAQKAAIQTILFFASKHGVVEIVEAAIGLGAKPDKPDKQGYNSLCICNIEMINVHAKDPKILKSELFSNLEKVEIILRAHDAHVGRYWPEFRNHEPFKSQTAYRPASRPASREVSKTEIERILTDQPPL